MEWYGRNYKKLFFIPLALLAISIIFIGLQVSSTGSFVHKGVSLSGGVSATFSTDMDVSVADVEATLRDRFPQADIVARSVNAFGTTPSFIVDAADIDDDTQKAGDLLESQVKRTFQTDSVTVETTGPSLGASFFLQTITGILLAFLWMGWVVFLYFGDGNLRKILFGVASFILTAIVVQGVLSGVGGAIILGIIVLISMFIYFYFSIPSGAVILAAASTILFTLAMINIIGLRLSTAGVAAFLMLIGYSVDTDILLSTRVLKRHDSPLNERIVGAFKTGITMQITTTAAVFAAFLLTSSEVIRQIMLIILIGMAGDIIFTWLQNAGIIYWYVKKQGKDEYIEKKEVKQKVVLGKRRLRRKRL